ncbi:MAG: SIS domain-containing protein [Candidatus Ranarchaeia archaeon]|jgi:glucose/mannose-6-phosphate isomerase
MTNKYDLPIPKSDTHNMLSGLLDFPEDFLSSFESTHPPMTHQTEGIIIAGMGGSGIVGDYIVAASKDTIEIPILSFKGGPLPKFVNRNWTAFVVSYSGNTEETLEVLDETLSRKIPTFVVTSGGKMIEVAEKHNTPIIQIRPGILAPRMGLPQMFISIYTILIQAKLLPSIENTAIEVKQLLDKVRSDFITSFKKGEPYLGIPKNIIQGDVVVYAETDLLPVAYRCKCQLNENVKTKAWKSEFPEACHNDVEAWNATSPQNVRYSVFHIQKECKPSSMSTYKTTFRNLLEKQQIPQYCIEAKGTHPISQLLTTTYQVDLLSYYLATMNGRDPFPIPGIRWVKQERAKINSTK